MLAVRDLTFRRGGATAIARFSFEFEPGRAYAVLGPNGAGKSTLLSLLAGLAAPASGGILYAGRELSGIPRPERARLFAFLPQNEAQDVPFTVGEYVRFGAFGRPGGAAAAAGLLDEVGLAGFADRRVETLSGGEFRLAGIARMLLQETPLLLADELDQGLDLANRDRLCALLCGRVRAGGRTLVAVIHDVNAAARHFDAVLLLARGGALLAAGPPRSVVTKPNLDALYLGDFRIFDLPGAEGPFVAPARTGAGA